MKCEGWYFELMWKLEMKRDGFKTRILMLYFLQQGSISIMFRIEGKLMFLFKKARAFCFTNQSYVALVCGGYMALI